MNLTKQAWMLVGLIAAIAVGTGYFLKNKTASTDAASNTNSQLPSTDNTENYTAPPNIGFSNDAPTYSYPVGGGVTYTTGQSNSLPLSSTT
jgi:hypothetical protein